MNGFSNKNEPHNTNNGKQIEEKSFLGSSYSYQEDAVAVGPFNMSELAESEDD